MNALSNFDLTPFNRISVGMDSMFDNLLSNMEVGHQNYPPYNIVKHSDDHFAIELAVAGFTKKDINIEVENSSLKISVIAKSEDDNVEMIHKGISTKDFVKTFALAEFVEVKSAEIIDGILSIELIKNIPEEKKPKTIKIK